jgi:hypothetical protein
MGVRELKPEFESRPVDFESSDVHPKVEPVPPCLEGHSHVAELGGQIRSRCPGD